MDLQAGMLMMDLLESVIKETYKVLDYKEN